MANWLSRIDPRRRKSSGAAQSEPQPYELTCACGLRTIGIRMPKHQQVMCKQCGDMLFVLPHNVYPAPPPVMPEPVPPEIDAEDALRQAAEKETQRKSDGLLGELADESRGQTQKAQREQEELRKLREQKSREEDAESQKPTRTEKKKRSAAQKKEDRAARREARRKRKEDAQNNPLTAKVPLKERVRKQITPFRVIVVSAVLLIAITTWWQVRSGRIESARLRFDTARKKAMELLAEGEIVEAEPLLSEAADAADLVDRQDEHAIKVRQLHLEINALNNMAETSVFDALSSATSGPPDDMGSAVMSKLGGKWIVLDTWVRPVKRIDGDLIEYVVDLPVFTNNVLVETRVQTTAFTPFRIVRSGAPIVFAAKIESCEAETRKKKTRLMVRLDEDSVRLWANKLTYKALGFSDDELPSHLDQQAALMGIEP